MDITDIPDQIAKAFKYSLRSRSAFILSLLTAIAVFAFAYDLVYGFFFIRWYNVKDPHYGWPYLIGLLIAALLFPLTIGTAAQLRARSQGRPFRSNRIGIAIAPFEVFSVAPETLGTTTMLQALDIVSTQFFRVVESTLSEFELANHLEFRFLPQYTKIANKQQALDQLSRLNATIVVWGSIIQRSREPLEIRLNMQAPVKTYAFSDLSIEHFPMLPLQYFTFLEAAKAAQNANRLDDARRLFQQALALGEQLDQQMKTTSSQEIVKEFLARFPPSPAMANTPAPKAQP